MQSYEALAPQVFSAIALRRRSSYRCSLRWLRTRSMSLKVSSDSVTGAVLLDLASPGMRRASLRILEGVGLIDTDGREGFMVRFARCSQGVPKLIKVGRYDTCSISAELNSRKRPPGVYESWLQPIVSTHHCLLGRKQSPPFHPL
jgi:hypothetical protein